jgi:tRNA A37 N6-isopentenylltransferase MiaA
MTALLLQINQDLSTELQRRFDELVAKRQAEAITPDELRELVQITDQIEQRDAQRLAALDELARLRRMPLSELMDALGIQPPAYA